MDTCASCKSEQQLSLSAVMFWNSREAFRCFIDLFVVSDIVFVYFILPGLAISSEKSARTVNLGKEKYK